MLKKFELINYKNFKELITIDFGKVGGYKFNEDCLENQLISKMIIYGKNATGKSNLGNAIYDIRENWTSIPFVNRDDTTFLNTNSELQYAEFRYTFQFGKDELIYIYKKKSKNVFFDEELILNNERCFYFNFETKESDFDNLDRLRADTIIIDRFIHSFESIDDGDNNNHLLFFLKWLITNTVFLDDSVILKLYNYINKMSIVILNQHLQNRPSRINDIFFENLSESDNLKEFEDFLNTMGINCRLVLEKMPDDKYQLYFKNDKLIPFFENASSGTLAITNLYRRFQLGKLKPSFIYLDEFDAYYHYEMSDKLILYFKKYFPNTQIIMTTHNTNLMNNRNMRPDCLFLLAQNGTLSALCDATNRELREGHNLEKMYISGEFAEYE